MRITLLAATALLAVLPLLAPAPAGAQQRGLAPSGAELPPLPPDQEVDLRARITALNAQTREVTLQAPNGVTNTVKAGPAVRIEMLKVGDTVDARFIRSTALMVSEHGRKIPDNRMAATAARPMMAPGGVAILTTTVTARVVGIDTKGNTIAVVDPSGGAVYTVRVTDPERQKMLPKLRVGDAITAVVTESLAVSITPAT